MKLARVLLTLVLILALGEGIAQAQVAPAPPSSPGAAAPGQGAGPLTALVDQLLDLFPKVAGEVIEVQGNTLTLDAGQKDGVHPGLELEIYREGREIKHPRTGELLGRSEEPLGRVRITSVQEAFSQATTTAAAVKPGDRFRASSGKVNVVLLPLLGGVRESLIEASIQELVERLGATGRFRVSMGDPINVYLAQEGIKAEDFLQGKGVQQAAQRFKVENLLAIHFKRVQNKPYMEVRFYALPRPDPAISTAFFVPPSIRSAAGPPGGRFSAGGGPANPPEAKPRSLLARLLGGDLEAGTYSSGEGTIPLRQVAKLNFPVLAMDVAVAPADRIPRMVGQRRRSDLHVQDHRAAHGAGVDEVGALPRPYHLRPAGRHRRGRNSRGRGQSLQRKGRPQLVRPRHQERQAHFPGGQRRRFSLRRRSQG